MTKYSVPTPKLHTLNHSVFSEITPDSAYWIGFLMADGCVHQQDKQGRSRLISLQLSATDESHLEKYRAFLGSTHKINRKITKLKGKAYSQVNVSFRSNHIADDLISYGVVPRKSSIAKVIGLEDNRDFWRGAFDGDGSLGWSRGYPVAAFYGSKDLVEQFAAFANPLINSRAVPRKCGGIYHLHYGGRPAYKLAETLYQASSTHLERKYAKALAIIGQTGRE